MNKFFTRSSHCQRYKSDFKPCRQSLVDTESLVIHINCEICIAICNALSHRTENESGSVKKEKEKKNRKKDKENGSSGGEAGNHNDIDAPDAVVMLCDKTNLF